MKNIFLDTNVIIDFLADRKPFSLPAARIFNYSLQGIKISLKTNFKDFADAIQYNCALSIKGLDFIVTRDTKYFKKSTLPVLSPAEAISSAENMIK